MVKLLKRLSKPFEIVSIEISNEKVFLSFGEEEKPKEIGIIEKYYFDTKNKKVTMIIVTNKEIDLKEIREDDEINIQYFKDKIQISFESELVVSYIKPTEWIKSIYKSSKKTGFFYKKNHHKLWW